MSIREKYVTVTEASEILGVAPNTVRAWGASGKIPEYRHPANGYRLYKPEELHGFLERIEPTKPTREKRKVANR